jgi:hypothetical protein
MYHESEMGYYLDTGTGKMIMGDASLITSNPNGFR